VEIHGTRKKQFRVRDFRKRMGIMRIIKIQPNWASVDGDSWD